MCGDSGACLRLSRCSVVFKKQKFLGSGRDDEGTRGISRIFLGARYAGGTNLRPTLRKATSVHVRAAPRTIRAPNLERCACAIEEILKMLRGLVFGRARS